MTLDQFFDILIDAVVDSLKVFAVAIVFHIILSFFEDKISKKLTKHHKSGPLFGALAGLVPQCGISVVASDMYVKEHITAGTLLAVFIACNDEAIPIMLTNSDLSKILLVLPLLAIKLVLGFLVGFLADLFYRKSKFNVYNHHSHCHHEEEIHVGCCHHDIDNEEESRIHKHFVHPLIHSLKLLAYVFVITLIFGLLLGFIGDEAIDNFLASNKYLAPLYATIIGIIPNCASSVILTTLFIDGNLSFGSVISGLCVNAGLGGFYLLKKEKKKSKAFLILGILILVSLIAGYGISLIIGF